MQQSLAGLLKKRKNCRLLRPKKNKQVEGMKQMWMGVTPFASLKEYLKAEALWKMVDDDGLEAAVKFTEEKASSQNCAQDVVLQHYRDHILETMKKYSEEQKAAES